ncbi:MAG: OmpA family protein [Vibrio sp.]
MSITSSPVTQFVSTVALVLSCSVTTAAFANPDLQNQQDEFAYLPIPLANQVADLQDDDDDGVINARDRCPDTPEGSEIDNHGCGSMVNTSHTKQLYILFANNSPGIEAVFLSQIREMADFLQAYPTTSIELQGYASQLGSQAHNLALSKQRSEAVRDQLISDGVSAKRIKIVGYGNSVLAAEGDDEVSQARNRRVVATVVGNQDEPLLEWTIFTTLAK